MKETTFHSKFVSLLKHEQQVINIYYSHTTERQKLIEINAVLPEITLQSVDLCCTSILI